MSRALTAMVLAISVTLAACAPSEPAAKPTAPPPATKAPAASPAASPSPSPVASPAASPAASPVAAASPAASPAAAAAPMAPGKPAAGPLTKLRVSQPVSSLSFVTVYVGRTQNFYAEEGLDVEQLSTGGGGPEIQALLSGDVQFAATPGVGQMDVLKQGRRLLNVFNALDRNIINVVMHVDVAREKGVTPQSPFQEKLAALRGLKLGATRPGALTYQQAEYLIRRAGLQPQRDVEVVGAGEGPALIAALENRQVDVILQSVPVPEQLVARGRGIMLINNSAAEDPDITPFNMTSILVTPEYAERNEDIVGRFVRGSRKANQWILQATPDEIADAVSPDLGQTPREVLVAGSAAVKEATSRTGVLDRRAIENMVRMTESDVNVDELYGLFTDRFLR